MVSRTPAIFQHWLCCLLTADHFPHSAQEWADSCTLSAVKQVCAANQAASCRTGVWFTLSQVFDLQKHVCCWRLLYWMLILEPKKHFSNAFTSVLFIEHFNTAKAKKHQSKVMLNANTTQVCFQRSNDRVYLNFTLLHCDKFLRAMLMVNTMSTLDTNCVWLQYHMVCCDQLRCIFIFICM